MNVFEMRDRLVHDYDAFVRSFVDISDERVKEVVDGALNSGALWPSPLAQLNPAFEPGGAVDDLVREGVLHQACSQILLAKKTVSSGFLPCRPVMPPPGIIRPSWTIPSEPE
jgi:hypothetical protein